MSVFEYKAKIDPLLQQSKRESDMYIEDVKIKIYEEYQYKIEGESQYQLNKSLIGTMSFNTGMMLGELSALMESTKAIYEKTAIKIYVTFNSSND
tara:strand:+ start:652 stop:936 length:285 start_codon:yes stop_codon:yes gene_type:complete